MIKIELPFKLPTKKRTGRSKMIDPLKMLEKFKKAKEAKKVAQAKVLANPMLEKLVKRIKK